MNESHSDALVFFGATGDLAYKKIFPSLQAMVKRGHLNVPVIGVAKVQLDHRSAPGTGARQPGETRAESIPRPSTNCAACCAMSAVTTTIPATFQAIRKELGSAQRPAHYLAIPPMLVRGGRGTTRQVGLHQRALA